MPKRKPFTRDDVRISSSGRIVTMPTQVIEFDGQKVRTEVDDPVRWRPLMRELGQKEVPQGGLFDYHCPICHQHYVTVFEYEARQGRYCSTRCQRIAHSRTNAKWRSAYRRQARIGQRCQSCGTWLRDAQRSSRKFCSVKCRVKAHRAKAMQQS